MSPLGEDSTSGQVLGYDFHWKEIDQREGSNALDTGVSSSHKILQFLRDESLGRTGSDGDVVRHESFALLGEQKVLQCF